MLKKPTWIRFVDGEEIWPLLVDISDSFKLDPVLVASIIRQESAGNRYAMRFEPEWRYPLPLSDQMVYAELIGSTLPTEKMGQATSWGLMQVMGTVAREQGFKGWYPRLCEAQTGIYWGCKFLSYLRDRFGGIRNAVSAYNQGSPAKTSGGFYENQKTYVDPVFRRYRSYYQLD